MWVWCSWIFELRYIKRMVKLPKELFTNTILPMSQIQNLKTFLNSGDVNDMMIFKSFADSNPNVEWCPLSFNFNWDRSLIDVKIMNENWS